MIMYMYMLSLWSVVLSAKRAGWFLCFFLTYIAAEPFV